MKNGTIFSFPPNFNIFPSENSFKISENFQDVLDFVDTEISEPIDRYELITNFPVKVYTEKSQTLQEAQLTPQGLVILKEKDK